MEHDEHAIYIDEINEFEVHTATLTWACYTGCESPINSNTTNFACTTQHSDGVAPSLPFAVLQILISTTRLPEPRILQDGTIT